MTLPEATSEPSPVEAVKHGYFICKIPKGEKGPRGLEAKGWQLKENAISTEAGAMAINGANYGVLLLWSGMCSLDFDDYGVSTARAAEFGIDVQALMDAPDAVQIISGKPNRAKLLYRLPQGIEALPHVQLWPNADGKAALELRCSTKNGTSSQQDVMPPSDHPETNKPYRFGGKGDWRNPPGLPPKLLAFWMRHVQEDGTSKTKSEKRGRPRKGQKYSIQQVSEMLTYVSPDDYNKWRAVGIILGREFDRAPAAWDAYVEWSSKWDGVKARNHDKTMHEAFYEISQQPAERELLLGSIIQWAEEGGWVPRRGRLDAADHFLYIASVNKYLYRATGELWPAESVDFACSQINENGNRCNASTWLRLNRLITSTTVDPSVVDEITKDMDCREGTLVPSPGAALLNLYRRPTIALGNARLAVPFEEHVGRLFNKDGDADQFLNFMAHKVQFPGLKHRFALLITGEQGTGKDTAISMCTPAIGAWNVSNIESSALDHAFNEYEASAFIVISEAANSGELSRWAFNERTKVLIAGLPDEVKINPKYGHKYSVRRFSAVVVTSNHLEGGLYIPPDDRRYDVIEAATKSEMGISDPAECADYFNKLWSWYHNERGASHVAAFLHARDVSKFNPNTGQRRTAAHRLVVACGLQSDDAFVDALAALKDPPIVRMDELWAVIESQRPGDMKRNEFAAKANHAMGRLQYRRHLCPERKDGRWPAKKANGAECRVVVYASGEVAKEALNAVLAAPRLPF